MGTKGLLGTVGSWIRSAEPVVVYECRNCGATLKPKSERCPYCSHDTVAEYEIQ